MASLVITKRPGKSGPRYVVRYRLGGRSYPLVHAGSFRTLREARARRDLIAGELAAGRIPSDLLRGMSEAPRPTTTVSEWRDRYLESRIDIDDNTTKNYRSALKKLCEKFGDRDPHELRPSDIAEWVAELATTFKPGTVRLYVIAARLLLDYANCDPNPARDARVKLPKHVRDEPDPPSAEHVLAMLDAMSAKYRLMFVVIGQGALRVGEAVHLKWATSTPPGCGCGCPGQRRRRTKIAGFTCLSG